MKLPPYSNYKSSGVEWLGDVPENWEVRKLSRMFRYAKGRDAATLTKEYVGSNTGDYPVYSGQTENGGVMGRIETFEFEFERPVILVTTVGAKAMTTKVRLVRRIAWLHPAKASAPVNGTEQHSHRLSFRDRVQ